jgi:tetratricopeptide (TPR) repeat protein/serine phosphatase RsbU (regulator of sigma subunit)
MKNYAYFFTIVSCIALNGISFSQEYANPEYYLVDSLDLSILDQDELEIIEGSLELYHQARHDTDKVNALLIIVDESWDENVWPKYNEWVFQFSRSKINRQQSQEVKKFMKNTMGSTLGNKGYLLNELGYSVQALEYYKKALKIHTECGDLEGTASSLNNIGFCYKMMGNIPLALDYYFKSLKIKEQIGDLESIGTSYNNIGITYKEQGDTAQAMKYYRMSLEVDQRTNDVSGTAISLNNIGVMYYDNDNYATALYYYELSLEKYKEISNKRGIALMHTNMGLLYLNEDKIELGLQHLSQGIKLYSDMNDQLGVARGHLHLGNYYLQQGNFSKAEFYGESALEIALDYDAPENKMDAAELLAVVYTKQGRWKKALELRNLEIELHDSLSGSAVQNSLAKQQANYEFEKKQVELERDQALKDAGYENELALGEERKKKQETIIYFAFGGLLLLIAFLFFVFNRLKITRKQKNEIDLQKQELQSTHEQLSEHHKEISDSIVYAKRIQEAIMPSVDAMKNVMEQSFIMYLPKDVVAGDFYWMEEVEGVIYFAAADCTGHGVPGAMVSVVCSNALNKALLEEGIRETGKLLDRTREIVIERLAKGDEEVKDGMDISLCAFNKKSLMLGWSGANNPLWVLRKDAILETKADKQPIGVYEASKPFTSHSVQLELNDLIYVFTDGFQDQFGGPKGKKLKTKFLKEMLLKINREDMSSQQLKLETAFNEWKADLEQVDDVCMIGIRV